MSTAIKIAGGGSALISFNYFTGCDVAVDAEGLNVLSANNNVHIKSGSRAFESKNDYEPRIENDPLPSIALHLTRPISHYYYDYRHIYVGSEIRTLKKENFDE